MATLTARGFERPDEVRTFEKGRLEIIHLGDLALGRLTQEPGWHWAEHVGPITGTRSCQSHHVGFVISGRAHVVMDDGGEIDLVAGAAIEIPPGHDAWVVGDEPHVTLEFSGVRTWARPPEWADEAVVATILVTDVVGSTAMVERLGDSAWRELLAEHHGDVQRVLERFGGVEVKTTGDGVLATFQSAVRAVRAGMAVRDESASRGLSIRVGLHTGEVARSADDVRGLAVHVAARIMALADPDEVLVSATTRDLAEAADVDFEDRGSHVLKGVSGTRQVFSVGAAAISMVVSGDQDTEEGWIMVKDANGREGLSTGALAKELEASPAAVKKALATLKVTEADFVKAGCAYYYAERLPAIREALK